MTARQARARVERVPGLLHADRRQQEGVEQQVAGEPRLHEEPRRDEHHVGDEHRHGEVREQHPIAVSLVTAAPGDEPHDRGADQEQRQEQRDDAGERRAQRERQAVAQRRSREVAVRGVDEAVDREARTELLVRVVCDVAEHRCVEPERRDGDHGTGHERDTTECAVGEEHQRLRARRDREHGQGPDAHDRARGEEPHVAGTGAIARSRGGHQHRGAREHREPVAAGLRREREVRGRHGCEHDDRRRCDRTDALPRPVPDERDRRESRHDAPQPVGRFEATDRAGRRPAQQVVQHVVVRDPRAEEDRVRADPRVVLDAVRLVGPEARRQVDEPAPQEHHAHRRRQRHAEVARPRPPEAQPRHTEMLSSGAQSREVSLAAARRPRQPSATVNAAPAMLATRCLTCGRGSNRSWPGWRSPLDTSAWSRAAFGRNTRQAGLPSS